MLLRLLVAKTLAIASIFPAGLSARLFPLERLGPKKFGANLCDEASGAIQEQMFYAALRYNKRYLFKINR